MKKLLFHFLFLSLSIGQAAFAQTIEQSLNSDKVQWKFYCTTNCEIGKAGEKFPAKVPGTIHLDLLDNKLIPDPFYADNEKRLQWIDTLDWVYETTFDVDSNLYKQGTFELQFDGLDTYADVELNGISMCNTLNNMFVKWNIVIGSRYLKLKGNQLKIVFHSTLNEARKLKVAFEKENGYSLPEGERVFVRKAQYQFGWDFAPKFLGCGIWKGVKLIGVGELKINEVNFVLDSLNEKSQAFLHVLISCDNYKMRYDGGVKGFEGWPSDVWLKLKNLSTKEELNINPSRILLTKSLKYELPIKIDKKFLWNCNGKGSQIMNEFEISISNDSIHYITKRVKIGVRKIEFIQQKDSTGESFYFKLNGKPIFIKGANWVPADVFLPRVSHEKYRTLLTAAKDAGMNMLRVWGGGIYEDEYFYHLCDSLGIMVWQDMMFAGAIYPSDESYPLFEIEEDIAPLQNHACVVLICGNNEVDEAWKNWGWQQQFNYSKKDSEAICYQYELYFEKRIPSGIKFHGNQTSYIPSSPKFGWGHKESLTDGDSHYWGVWWGMEPYEMYKKRVPRFASEYGMQSLPCLETIRKFAPDSSLRINSVALRNHQKHPSGFENLDGYLKYYGFKVNGGLVKGRKVIPEYGKGNPDAIDSMETSLANLKGSPNLKANPTIKEFEDYINATQQLQADALRTAITAHLQAQPRCMGTIIWQLNDCWPGASWSLIDYYGNKKKAYYEVQKLFGGKSK